MKVVDIMQCLALEEGLPTKKPFMLKNVGLSLHISDLLVYGNTPVHGYTEHSEVDLLLVEAIQQYNNRSLKINIVDAPIPFKHDHWITNMSVCAVLTLMGKYTEKHIDPEEFGGGWMYLAEGRKFWIFETDEELIKAELTRDSFLYFPPGVAHAVYTESDSWGLGGYIMT